jgi:hypothetical protein
VIAEPRDVAERMPLAALALAVTETPWLRPARELPADIRVHAIALAAFFGHLNRIADAVAVPLDYRVAHEPPHADPSTPALAPAPEVAARTFDLSARPATASAIASWRAYVFERDAPLARGQRALIARRVGALLGHLVEGPEPATALDRDLLALADLVTLAPWQLADPSLAPLRAHGFDDAAIFDAVVTASTAGVVSRIAVAL